MGHEKAWILVRRQYHGKDPEIIMNIQLQKRTKDLTIDVKGVRKDKNNIQPENEKLGRNRTMTTKRKEEREGGRERKKK